MNCADVFALTGRLLSLHRLTGAHELPQAGSPLPDGKFFAEPQRGVALCGARESAAPAAGAKRKGHLRFPFLFGLLPFPCLIARRKSESGDRFEIGERQRILSTVGEHSVLPYPDIFAVPDTVLLHRWFHLRKRDIPVSRNSLTCYTGRHLRI